MSETQQTVPGVRAEPSWPSAVWKPRASAGTRVGVALVLLGGLALVLALGYASRQEIGPQMALALAVGLAGWSLLVACGVLTLALRHMVYILGPSALLLRWFARTEMIPYQRIDGVYSGSRLGKVVHVGGLNWPGYHVGRSRVHGFGTVQFRSTTTAAEHLTLVVTPGEVFGISPASSAAFREELIRRAAAGAGEAAGVRTRWDWLPGLKALVDPALKWSLGVGLVGLIAVLSFVMWYYPALSSLIALHFDAAGRPDLVGPRAEVFRMPAVAATVLVANTGVGVALYGKEPLVARLLWACSVVVQGVMMVASLRVAH